MPRGGAVGNGLAPAGDGALVRDFWSRAPTSVACWISSSLSARRAGLRGQAGLSPAHSAHAPLRCGQSHDVAHPGAHGLGFHATHDDRMRPCMAGLAHNRHLLDPTRARPMRFPYDAQRLSLWKDVHITCPTALRMMSISSSMEAAYMEIFQDNSPNTDLFVKNFGRMARCK